jgi:hypothetical protein
MNFVDLDVFAEKSAGCPVDLDVPLLNTSALRDQPCRASRGGTAWHMWVR